MSDEYQALTSLSVIYSGSRMEIHYARNQPYRVTKDSKEYDLYSCDEVMAKSMYVLAEAGTGLTNIFLDDQTAGYGWHRKHFLAHLNYNYGTYKMPRMIYNRHKYVESSYFKNLIEALKGPPGFFEQLKQRIVFVTKLKLGIR